MDATRVEPAVLDWPAPTEDRLRLKPPDEKAAQAAPVQKRPPENPEPPDPEMGTEGDQK